KERQRVAQRYRAATTGTHTLNRLTILTTTACNLNCTYCYADGGAYGGAINRLSAHHASAAIRNIASYYKGIKHIQFFGGEPLLNPELIEHICNDCKAMVHRGEMPYLPQFGATSNGTLWNDGIRDILKRHRIGLNISIDGPQDVHDRSRIDARGRGTFQKVFRTLTELKAHAIPFNVEVTYNIYSMQAGYSIWDIVQFFADNDIYNPHIVPASYAPDDSQRWTPSMRSQLVRDYREATRKAMRSLLTDRPMLFSFVSGTLSALLMKIPQPLVCAAGVHDLAIDTAGNIYPCFMFVGQEDFVFQSALKSLDNHDFRRRGHDFFLHNDKAQRSVCQTCWARSLCTGCLGAQQIENGHLDGKVLNCAITQTVAETILSELTRLRKSPADWQRFVSQYRAIRLGQSFLVESC
ncbi:MAG TPA: radical SAM protein, partial [Anaerolineae bacterium]|nr:radical SAM protein [Anaerolineae bacterium]